MPKDFLSSFAQAHMRGMDMAAREHSSLKLDLSQRINIFTILQQRGVWIIFQPLDALYGACLYQGKTIGILLNVKHPPSLQNFTAAHEYGHIVFQHGVRYDDEKSIFQSYRGSTVQEAEAQSFAAHFLMPIQLVNRVLRHMGLPLKPGKMSEQDVYQLSLRLGTSYLAMVNHLVSLKKLDPSIAQELQRKHPKDMKSTLRQDMKPPNSRADVWMIDEQDAEQQIVLALDDEIHLYLPEHEYTQNIQIIFKNDEEPPLVVKRVDMEMATQKNAQQDMSLTYVHHFGLQATVAGDAHLYVERRESMLSSLAFHVQVKIMERHKAGVLASQQQYL